VIFFAESAFDFDCLPIRTPNSGNNLLNFPLMPSQQAPHGLDQAQDFQLITGVDSRELVVGQELFTDTDAMTDLREIFEKDICALQNNRVPPRLKPKFGDYALELIECDVDENIENASEEPDSEDEP